MSDRQALKATGMRCPGDAWDGEMADGHDSTERGTNSAAAPRENFAFSRRDLLRLRFGWELPLLVAHSLLHVQRY